MKEAVFFHKRFGATVQAELYVEQIIYYDFHKASHRLN